jgi:hypothetical protein
LIRLITLIHRRESGSDRICVSLEGIPIVLGGVCCRHGRR